MRRRLKLTVALLALMLLAACGSPDTQNAENIKTDKGTESVDTEKMMETMAKENGTGAYAESMAGESGTGAYAETMAGESGTGTYAETIAESMEEISQESVYVDFVNGQPQNFEAANGWCNGSMFNVTWRKSNVTFNDGKMQLIIDKDATPENNVPYSGGEFRSKDFYGYGRYEVSMKAIKNDGVVSSFFTYTGPSDNNPWDEIDIEILGKNTTKVQFNYFTNGKGNHEYMHELGFDAAEDFHTYAFEWHKDKIIWFIDGVEVHSAITNIPVTKGKIMMNAWCGTGVDAWLKPFDDSNLPLTAEYQWIKYTPFE